MILHLSILKIILKKRIEYLRKKYFIFIIINVFTFGFLTKAEEKKITKESPAQVKLVEMEWEPVPGASSYELDLLNYQTLKSLKIFSSKTNKFRLNFKMGKYLFKARILDEVGTPSPWTEAAELLIGGSKVIIKTQPNLDVPILAERKSGLAKLELQWIPADPLEQYVVRVFDQNKNKLEENIVKHQDTAQLKLKPGAYYFKVAPLLPDGNFGEESDFSELFHIFGAKLDPPILELTKTENEFQKVILIQLGLNEAHVSGTLYYMPLEGEFWNEVEVLQEYKENSFSISKNYVPGNYKIKLKTQAKGFTDSEFQQMEFVVKPLAKEL